MSSSPGNCRISVHLLSVLVFLAFGSIAEGGNIVRFLPGFPGALPFKLETGYVGVGNSEMFYLFVESQGNPEVDPLIIYTVGGPGCSALNGFFFQTGPLQFNEANYTGDLPTLHLYPYTWTKSASIIFIDAPVGTGYSYSTDLEDYYMSDLKSANQTYAFIRKWLIDHPRFIPNRFFIGSDSYAGVIAPMLAQQILIDNKAGVQPSINLVGIISGSPHTDEFLEDNSIIPTAHQLALISKTLYDSAKTNCNENFIDVDESNAACLEDLEKIDQCLKLINDQMVLAPKCATVSPNSSDDKNLRRSLKENSRKFHRGNNYWCKNFGYELSYKWANDKSVQRSLHVREGTMDYGWKRCNLSIIDSTYTYNVLSSIDYHKNLTKSGLQILIYSGDHDLVVPRISSEKWISTLNLTVDEEWRPWFVTGQIAGYTLKYSNYGYRLTYATLKGSGHSPTEWKGKETYEMFERWIHFYPL